MRIASIAALSALACIASACALKDIPLTLPTKGLQDTVAGGRGRHVVVMPFSEDRSLRERCGMQKSGFNMDSADAVCQSDPSVWIAQLLADELRASGFSVRSPEQQVRASALQIDGQLLELFVEPVLGAWSSSLEADLSVRLRATSGTGLSADRTFFVKGWKGGAVLGTAQPYHTALHRSTQALLEEMVRAIIELMDAYPQLGAAGSDLRMTVLLERCRA